MAFSCRVSCAIAFCSLLVNRNVVTVESQCTNVLNADVVIVGAGFAGISAYKELKRRKPYLNVVMLEATNRVGGRIQNEPFGGTMIELGPNWFFAEGTPIRTLAAKYNISTSDTVWRDIAAFDINGNDISRQVASRYRYMIQRESPNQPGGPLRQMALEAEQFWDGTAKDYDGSENVMDVMNSFGYVEQNEVDAYIRWNLIDYDYMSQDVALMTFDASSVTNNPLDSQPFVVDPRGIGMILSKYKSENRIPDPIFGIQVTDIIYDNDPSLGNFYKALVRGVKSDGSCVQYKARRVIVTVPAGVLSGNGYAINFSPPIYSENQPSVMGQFNKFFCKFSTKFWDDNQFIAILRDQNYRGVCNHWQNMDINIPGSNILMCIMTNEGMEKYVSMGLTESDLLEPLRTAYGNTVVDSTLLESRLVRHDLNPATGYGAYSSLAAGYSLVDYYKFYGGNSPNGFVKGVGTNSKGDWIVHISGAASCLEYHELIDGAFFSGQRSARFVLKSLRFNVNGKNMCDNF